MPAWRSVLEASVAVRSSLLFGTFVAIAAVVPGFFLDRQAGAFLPPILISYLVVIGVSMLVALVVTPSLGLMLLPGRSDPRESPVLRWFRDRHGSLLTRAVRRPRWAYAAIAVALVIGVAMFPFLDRSSNVRLRENDLLIRWDAAPGTSLTAMNGLTADVVDRLGALEGVEQVGAHVGRAIHSDQIVNINSGEIWLTLDDSADHDASVASIEQVLATYPDLSHRVTTYAEQRITDVLEGRDRDVVVRVYGANKATLEAKADEIRGALSGIEGIERPQVEVGPHRADDRGRGGPPARAAVRREARRCPPSVGDPPLRAGRGQPVRGAEGVRRGRVGNARHPPIGRGRRAAADRYADRRAGPPP